MAGVEFVVQLLDKVSAPSKAIASSLGKIEAAAKGIDKLDPLSSLKPKGGSGPAFDLFGKPDFTPVIGGLTAIASAAAVAATAVAAIGTAAAVAFGKATLDAAIFRETSIKSLDVAFGVGQGAGRFEQAKNLALEYGESLETVVGAFREFKQAGFDDTTSLNLFKGLQDLRVASPTAAIDRIILAIKQIKSTGKLQGDELLQLSDAGVDSGRVFDALSKKTGKTVDELKKMQETGKLTADLVIPAIQEAMKAMTGGKAFGELAKDATRNTLGGALRGLSNLPGLLFDTIAKNVDTKALTGLVGQLTDFLTGPQSQAALATAGQVFGSFVSAGAAVIQSIGGALDGLFSGLVPTGASFAEALMAGAKAIENAAPAIGQLVTAVGGPFVAAFAQVAATFEALSPEAKLAGFQAIQAILASVAVALSAAAIVTANWISQFGSVVAVLLEIQAIINQITEALGAFVAQVAEFNATALGNGFSQMGGMFGGIQSAAAGMVSDAGASTINSNQNVSVNAAGFGADELAARVAQEVQNALRTLVPQVA